MMPTRGTIMTATTPGAPSFGERRVGVFSRSEATFRYSDHRETIMRIGYLECFAGLSGDMLLGALVDAGVSSALLQQTPTSLNPGATLVFESVDRSGISARKARVLVGGDDADAKHNHDGHEADAAHNHDGSEADAAHNHAHPHDHDHHHHDH